MKNKFVDMKRKLAFIVLIIAGATSSYCQDSTQFNPRPYFSAIIVAHIDSSVAWYQSLFAMKVINRIDVPEKSMRVVILQSSNFLLELIEDRLALIPGEILKNKPADSNIRGYFKIGFKVSDIDSCLKRLQQLNIEVERVYKDDKGKRNFLINDPDGNLVQFFD